MLQQNQSINNINKNKNNNEEDEDDEDDDDDDDEDNDDSLLNYNNNNRNNEILDDNKKLNRDLELFQKLKFNFYKKYIKLYENDSMIVKSATITNQEQNNNSFENFDDDDDYYDALSQTSSISSRKYKISIKLNFNY